MAVSFISPKLTFTRDGRRLIVLDPDAITLVDTQTSEPRRIAIDTPSAAIGFVDHVWVAHGGALSRIAVGGQRLGTSLALREEGELIAAAVAAPAAVWGRTAIVLDDHGRLATASAPSGDIAVPLTARRWIVANGSRVTAPSGLSCELASGSRVIAGTIVLDGASVLVLADGSRGRELVMIGLANGRPQLRHVIAPHVLRVANRRGLVGVHVEPRRIGVLDLRSGRLLGEVTPGFDVADFAFDPDGKRIVLRDEATAIEVLDLQQALDAARVRVVPPSDFAPAEPDDRKEIPAAVITPEPEPVAPTRPTIVRPLGLSSLVPREPGAPLERAAALELLDREMRRVGLLTLQAIARAWDTRRIGYGNEGQHPYEHEVAALLGMNTGFAQDHVEAARVHLDAHQLVETTLPDPRGEHMPLGALARELGLSPLAVDVLLVIAAPGVWSEAARLYGVLANDPGRALVDEALVVQVLDGRASRHDIAAELAPRAPLVRYGIVAVDARRARPFAALSIDPIVLARLRSEVPDLGPGVSVRGSARALEELSLPSQVIPAALSVLARTHTMARIALRGRPNCGRRTLLAAIAAEAGRALGIVDVSVLPRGERLDGIRDGLQRALLAGLLPCVLGLELEMAGEPGVRDAIADVLRAHPGPLAVVLPPTEDPPLAAGYIAIDIPVLAERERMLVWQTTLDEAGLSGADPSVLAARYRIGAGAIYRAIAAARERSAPDVTATIESFIRQTRDARLGAHARRVDRLASWNSLVLPNDIVDSLRELVARVRYRRTVFETWGMERQLQTSRGLTALFSGPPGTGKTLVAGVIARELGLELYQVELSKLMSKWIGETERNLASIFDAAEDGQVILLFDEADSLFAKRTEVRSSNDRYANLEVNYLLQRLDSFEGIAILTTNAATAIDPAFKRRMSFRLSFPFPDEETRVELWRAHLPATLPVAGTLALDKLARKYQLSGGYIRNACLRAAFLAAMDQTAVGQAHLERAVALEFAELGKLSSGGSLD